MRRIGSFFVVFALAFSLDSAAEDSRRKLIVNLKFVPQEGVKSTVPDLPREMQNRAVDLRVQDGRSGGAPLTIGQGTNDDDKLFPIVAGGDVIGYIEATLQQVATDWGLKLEGEKGRILTLSVARFIVDESNKALGSVYRAEVSLSYVLADVAGKRLVEGAASGTAHRYGRARSADNCNEVLSDALKEAFADVFSSPQLQASWASGTAVSGPRGQSTGKETLEDRLRTLDDLLNKGIITKDEYTKKRAEILNEI